MGSQDLEREIILVVVTKFYLLNEKQKRKKKIKTNKLSIIQNPRVAICPCKEYSLLIEAHVDRR